MIERKDKHKCLFSYSFRFYFFCNILWDLVKPFLVPGLFEQPKNVGCEYGVEHLPCFIYLILH
jgi:hypothetical protein